MKVVGSVLVKALETLAAIVAVLVPLLGFWVASSLAAYLNGPLWLCIAAGGLLFPAAPVLWEIWAARRRRKLRHAMDRDERVLTLFDRLVLRTLGVNLLALTLLVALNPSSAFAALSTRGDWFLDRSEASWKPQLSAVLFRVADQLEWLHELTHENPHEDGNKEQPAPDPSAAPDTRRDLPKPPPAPKKTPGERPDPSSEPKLTESPTVPHWPMARSLHRAASSPPSAALVSISALGAHLRQTVPNSVALVKAVHDWVAGNIAYDAVALAEGRYPPQDAETVFRMRIGVCAGYAKLMVALGKAAGVKVVYVTGVSRDSGGDVSGQGHAWNAVEIDGRWYLMDATWDAGYVDGRTFTRKYSSDYLFTPPEVFLTNHLPKNPRWQLRAEPINRGEFIRRPNLRPWLQAVGLKLVSPRRSQISAIGAFEARFRNGSGAYLTAFIGHKGSETRTRCKTTPKEAKGAEQTIRCEIPGKGTYHVKIFAGEPGARVSWFSGQFEVNTR